VGIPAGVYKSRSYSIATEMEEDVIEQSISGEIGSSGD
jgi:hypothetical protein